MNTQRLFELRSSAHNESSEQVHLPNLYQGNVIPSVDPRNKEHQSFYFSHPSVSTYFSSSLCSCYWPWKMKELWSLTASMNAHSWISLCTQIQVRLGTYVASWYCYTILPIPSLPVWLGTGFKYIYFFFSIIEKGHLLTIKIANLENFLPVNVYIQEKHIVFILFE